MTIGDKIRFIRNFRAMTQKEVGIALGISEKNAAKRIHQYEKNEKIPRDDVVEKMAEIMNVSHFAVAKTCDNEIVECFEDFMWSETYMNMLSKNMANNYKFLYIERTQSQELLSKIINELEQKQRLLWNQTITTNEYIEFKLQWPENSMYYEEIINYGSNL